MPQPEWEALEREVRELTERVAYLEQLAGVNAQETAPVEVPEAVTEHPLAQMPGMLPVVGRSLLGLAGAYLLRAFTESGTLSVQAGVGAGIIYALAWLFWAARTPATEQVKTALASLTAVLVLCPLLWEATIRFHAIGTWTAAGLLLAFAVFGMGISWRKSLLIVSTFATVAALGTAGALLLATHDVLPFTFLFLAVAAAIEASACLEHWMSERWLGATAADLAVLLATWLVSNPHGLPPSYAPIPHAWLLTAQVTLLAIYLSSTIIRTLLRGFSFTTFEIAQCAIAFAVSFSGGFEMAPGMAVFVLVCAAACYLVSFALLDREGELSRNFYTYSTFAILLTLAGTRILLSGALAAGVWSILAITGICLGGWFVRLTLHLHGGVYLILALASSGALREATDLLLGSALWPSEHQVALWSGLATATIAFALAARFRVPGTPSKIRQTFRIAIAASLVWLVAGIVAGMMTGAYHVVFGATASHAYCATMRTGVLAGLSLLLAWASTHLDRPELSRLVYPALALGGYRLVATDLHQGNTGALFLSLLLLGGVLTMLPRLKKSWG